MIKPDHRLGLQPQHEANLNNSLGTHLSSPEGRNHATNDDHHYTQNIQEASVAISKQLSSEHSYISNPIVSPTIRGISLLQPSCSSQHQSPNLRDTNKDSSLVEKGATSKKVNDLEVVEEAVANIPGDDSSDNHLDTSTKDVSVDADVYKGLDEPISIDTNVKKSNVNYVCYFSLIRDLYRACPNHKMSLQSLEEAVELWQETEKEVSRSSSGSSCMWLSRTDSWVAELSSSIAFLLGAFPNEYVPGNFSPFVKCDADNEFYEWIGTGRDSDVNLMALTQWWWERKDLAGRFILPGTKEHREEMIRNQECNSELQTSDTMADESINMGITASTTHEKIEKSEEKVDHGNFHTQERRRMENPGQAFTYHYPGVKVGPVSVGPVRTNLNINQRNNKVKPHPLLLNDRPPWVTMIVLVQDALARLPNGEGSKSDICKYVTHSRYCNLEGVVDNPPALTTVVSGALDRLQGETDPCCKYYTDRKIWKYLHKGRLEEEFMRRHREKQGHSSLSKATTPSKASRPIANPIQIPKETREPSTDALVENANAVNSILPTTSDFPLLSLEQPLLISSLEQGSSTSNPVVISTSSSLTSGSMVLQSPLHYEHNVKKRDIQVQSPPSIIQGTHKILSPTSSKGLGIATPPTSVQMLKIMTPQGLKTVSLASSNKSIAPTPTIQHQPASVLKRNLAPSFTMSSPSSLSHTATMSSTKQTGSPIQIQIQAPLQPKLETGGQLQPHRPTLLRPMRTSLSNPGASIANSPKIVQRQQPSSVLQISSK